MRARSFTAAATAARALLEAMLAEPVPAGRRRTATATTRTRVVLAVLYLTLGYSKVADRVAMKQLEALTGSSTKTIGRFLGQLATRGWLTYRPADRYRGRSLGEIALHPTAATHGPAPGPKQKTQPVNVVTAVARHLIETVLREQLSLATLRVVAVLLANLVSWLHTDGGIDTTAVAERAQLHPKTVGRKLKTLADLGLILYQPGRGRGLHGTIRLLPPHRPETDETSGAAVNQRRARKQRPEAAAPLTCQERERVNDFLGRVCQVLEYQQPGQSHQVVAGLEQLRRKQRLGQLILSILHAHAQHQLLEELTACRGPQRAAYAGVADPAAALFRRVQNFHSTLGLTLATRGTASTSDHLDRTHLNLLLTPFLDHSTLAGPRCGAAPGDATATRPANQNPANASSGTPAR